MSTWRWNEFVNKLTVFLTDEAVNKAKDTTMHYFNHILLRFQKAGMGQPVNSF